MNNTNAMVGRTIKKIANATGLKQYVLAEKCGYTEQQFSFIVNGHKSITPDVAYKLCKGLDVTPNQLYDYKEVK